tara:strand:- start:3309 stop:3923 length:615 start_codon:yes stop_codon:yes gene_type:complete
MHLVMTPFDTYKQYLAYKNHFTKEKYDYHKYGGQSRAKIESFYKRKDRYFFEKTSRKYKDEEVCDFFLANFVATDNPQGVWIGNIIKTGEVVYKNWMKRQQSLFYNFKQGSEDMMDQYDYEEFFNASKGHPPILKEHLAGRISVEEMCIYEKLFSYCKDYDKQLDDPVWKTISMKIKKYLPFLNIDRNKYRNYLLKRIQERYNK